MAPPTRSFAVALAVMVQLAGCSESHETGQANDSSPQPASRVREAESATGHEFSGKVPRLRGEPAPRDTLRMVRQFGDTSVFGTPTGVRRVGRHLVVSDRFMDPHLSVWELANGRLVQRIGRNGKGPREMLDPLWFVADEADPDRVWVYDFGGRRFTLLDPGNQRQPVVREVPLDAGVSLSGPVWAGNRIITNGLFPDYTLLTMGEDGRVIERLAADPPFKERDMPHATGRRLLNRSFLAANPSRTRLVLTYQWKSRVDFFTIGGERIGSVQGPRETSPVFRVSQDRFFWGEDDENEMAYWTVDATERYVYALFCGCFPGEGNMPAYLHVFDWNGNFVAEVAFDRQVTALDVTDDDQMLYATFEAPYPGVGEWRLPPRFSSQATAGSAAGGNDST
jgi:hypothetical protein